jgi:Na+-translocating ferredoxin:NAD+ oxidoreductase RnfG subunit
VGYGDISGSNSSEKYVSNFIMVLGVILFSLISTAITTIIQNYDNINIEEQEQRAILDKIISKYDLSKKL